MEERLLTPGDVGKLLGKSRLTAIGWLAKGFLKGIKVGNSWRVKPADLDAFVEAQRPSGPRGPGREEV
jgi:excisionase family DNA binding protein